MADIFEMTSTIIIPGSIPSGLSDAWSDNLGAQAISKIKSRWDQVAGEAGAWAANVAAPSNNAWSPMVNSAFVSRSGRTQTQIQSQQLQKLSESHQNAKEAHDRVFANDGEVFKASVAAKKGNWERGVAATIGMVGTRAGAGVRGPVVRHVLALSGDSTFLRDSGGDVIIGDFAPATPFVSVAVRQPFKAAMTGLLTQCGVLISKGAMTVAAANTRLDALITGFLDATYAAPTASFVHFTGTPGALSLHTLITT